MGDTDFQADAVRQLFQCVFEDIAVGRIAPAAIAKQQHRGGLGIMESPVMLPGEGHAITSEFAGVVADAEIDVPVIALDIVDAVRVDDARGIAGKIVIQGFDGFLRVRMALAKKIADEFLLLGVDTENGIARPFIKGPQACDVLELAIAEGMVFEGAFFQGFASAQAMLVEQLNDNGNTDPKPALRQLGRHSSQREIGPQGACPHGVARCVGSDDLQEGSIETWEQAQACFSAAPFFRE